MHIFKVIAPQIRRKFNNGWNRESSTPKATYLLTKPWLPLYSFVFTFIEFISYTGFSDLVIGYLPTFDIHVTKCPVKHKSSFSVHG